MGPPCTRVLWRYGRPGMAGATGPLSAARGISMDTSLQARACNTATATCLQRCYCHVPAALLLPRACSATTATCLQRCYCHLPAALLLPPACSAATATCLQRCYCYVPAALLLPRACSAATAACLQRCYCMLRACYWRVPVNAKTRCPYVLLPGAIEWLGGHTIYTLL